MIEILEKYKNKRVAVGVEHQYDHTRLFYHFGQLSRIEDDRIYLENLSGFRIINISDIIDFHLAVD